MPITQTDIKLLEAQRMTDFEDGGGRMTGTVIADGVSNNIFPDVSELDRTFGRVNLRKTFPAVLTTTTDVYYGAHLIIEQPVQDDYIDVLLFSTEDWNDERLDAQDTIERYVVSGPVGPWFLYDTQVVGQKQILMFARAGATLPNVGEVLYLIENEGTGSEFSQYLRVTEVSSQTQTFTDSSGEFTREIITCKLSDALRETYHGAAMSRLDTITPAAKVRTTLVADASKYYGTQTLAVDALTSAASLEVSSVYGQLVPSARSETPVVDTPLPTKPVSLTSGGETFEIIGPSHTHAIDVTLSNRSSSYVATLLPIPTPGQLVVEYRALGQWYRIEDDGTGILDGAGSGSINFNTGSVSVTLQALPDVDSAILFTWSATVHYTDRAGTAVSDTPVAPISLGAGASPGSVSFSWLAGGLTKTATVANTGVVSGDATGYFIHATGEGYLEFTPYPDAGSNLTVDWSDAPNTFVETITPAIAGGQVSFTLANVPVKPGSVMIGVLVKTKKGYERTRIVNTFRVVDGKYVYESATARALNEGEQEWIFIDDPLGTIPGCAGTINYATGACVLYPDGSASSSYYQANDGNWTRSSASVTVTGDVFATYAKDAGTPAAHTTTLPLPDLTLTLLPAVSDSLIPGTLRFTFGGQSYSDRAGGGVLYLTDGTVAGEVDYDSTLVRLTSFGRAPPSPSTPSFPPMRSGMTTVTFFAPPAPLFSRVHSL